MNTIFSTIQQTHAIADAFCTLAGWPVSSPAIASPAHVPARPAIIAATRFCEPAAVIAANAARQTGRDMLVIEAELRGRYPRLTVAVARAGTPATPAQDGYIPWMSLDGHTLWLVSAFTPHPDIGFYRLDPSGLSAGETLPWMHDRDRLLGERHAEILLARLLETVA